MTAGNIKNRKNTARNPNKAAFYFHLCVAIAFLLLIAVWTHYWVRGELEVMERIIETAKYKWGISVLLAGGLIYILLLSLPFVPGVELGILLMCIFGKEGIVFVYIATVAGLVLAFLMGRALPKKWADALSNKLGFARPGGNRSDEIISLLGHFFCNKKWLSTLFSDFRYLAIAILFNMPGAYLIGGGGGISLACGMSRSISFKMFLPTVVLAVSPVPLLTFLGVIQSF